jgi:hypothetical protein
VEAEEARSALRAEWREGTPSRARRKEILDEALAHVTHQLELVARRREKLDALQAELEDTRSRVLARMRELHDDVAAS